MTQSEQSAADAHFARQLGETGSRDPREFYRQLLRELKDADAEAYEEMVNRYRSGVAEPIEKGADNPLALWLSFGIEVANRLHPGRTMVIGEDGRGRSFEPPPDHRQLLLHLPDDARTRAIPVGIPPEPTPAQSATLDLLVQGRTRLPESA